MQSVRTSVRIHVRLLVALVALGATTLLIGGVAGAATTTLSNGAQLAVTITAPASGTELSIPPGNSSTSTTVSGTASVGVGAPDATIIYVMDVSGSTGGGSGTGCAPILSCEKQFFVALNNAAIADGSTDLVGVVRFASNATTALGLTNPTSPAVNTAINGAAALDGTNCAAGLANALALATSAANTNGHTVVVFASDGACNEGGSVATAANALGAHGCGRALGRDRQRQQLHHERRHRHARPDPAERRRRARRSRIPGTSRTSSRT